MEQQLHKGIKMEREIFLDTKQKMDKAIDHYKKEVSFIRTGRASINILNPVKVDYYGVPTPLSNIANITIPEAQLISINPFDPSSLELIEKALKLRKYFAPYVRFYIQLLIENNKLVKAKKYLSRNRSKNVFL